LIVRNCQRMSSKIGHTPGQSCSPFLAILGAAWKPTRRTIRLVGGITCEAPATSLAPSIHNRLTSAWSHASCRTLHTALRSEHPSLNSIRCVTVNARHRINRREPLGEPSMPLEFSRASAASGLARRHLRTDFPRRRSSLEPPLGGARGQRCASPIDSAHRIISSKSPEAAAGHCARSKFDRGYTTARLLPLGGIGVSLVPLAWVKLDLAI